MGPNTPAQSPHWKLVDAVAESERRPLWARGLFCQGRNRSGNHKVPRRPPLSTAHGLSETLQRRRKRRAQNVKASPTCRRLLGLDYDPDPDPGPALGLLTWRPLRSPSRRVGGGTHPGSREKGRKKEKTSTIHQLSLTPRNSGI